MAQLLWLNSNLHFADAEQKLIVGGASTRPYPVSTAHARFPGTKVIEFGHEPAGEVTGVGLPATKSFEAPFHQVAYLGGFADNKAGAQGFYWYYNPQSASTTEVIQIANKVWSGGPAAVGLELWLEIATGTLRLYRNDPDNGGRLKIATAISAMSPGTGYWIEEEWLVHSTSGYYRVYLGDSLYLSFGGSTQGPDPVPSGAMGGGGNVFRAGVVTGDIETSPSLSQTTPYSDLHFLGEGYFIRGPDAVRLGSDTLIGYVQPSAAGTHGDSTQGGAASRLGSINELIHDDAADYNILSNVGEKDTFECDGVSLAGDEIFGIQVVIRARMVGSGTVTFAPYFVIDGVSYSGVQTTSDPVQQHVIAAAATEFVTYLFPFTNSPATGLPFTKDVLNGVFELGYELVASSAGGTLEITQLGYEVMALSEPAATVMHMKTLD